METKNVLLHSRGIDGDISHQYYFANISPAPAFALYA